MEEVLNDSIKAMTDFGLEFWAKKLELCLAYTRESESRCAQEVLKLYGGFGSLNDIAFSDEDAPKGMSGEQATKEYLRIINNLHRAAKQHVT